MVGWVWVGVCVCVGMWVLLWVGAYLGAVHQFLYTVLCTEAPFTCVVWEFTYK